MERSPRDGWVGVATALAALVGLAAAGQGPASVQRAQPAGTLLETVTFPATAYLHNGPLLKSILHAGKSYTLVVSGTADLSPSASFPVDPVYCFTACNPPKMIGFIQLSWYRGSRYSHFTTFGITRRPPYNPAHSYEETLKPTFDARLRVGVGGFEIEPRDNTGSFTVKVYGPPPQTKRAAPRALRWPVPPPTRAKAKKVGAPRGTNYLQFSLDPWYAYRPASEPRTDAVLCLGSRAKWSGATELQLPSYPPSSTPGCDWASDELAVPVWTAECPGAPQEVVFRRTFYALGKPSSARFSSMRHPRSRITRVVLNGQRLSFIGGGTEDGHLTAESRAAFRPSHELNRLEVHGSGACNLAAAPENRAAALQFWFTADFRADLKAKVTKEVLGDRTYKFPVEITNVGPSDAVGFGFNFYVDVDEPVSDWKKGPPEESIEGFFSVDPDSFRCDYTNVHSTPIAPSGGPDPTFRAGQCLARRTLLAGKSAEGAFFLRIRTPHHALDGGAFTRKFQWRSNASSSYPGSNGDSSFGSGVVCRPEGRCKR